MRKLRLLIFVVVSFMIFSLSVFAKKNDGKIYEIFWREAGVNVFASDITTGGMDYNGWFIESTSDDDIYYCIEPSSYMQNKQDAVYSTHEIYDESKEIKKYIGLSDMVYRRVQLLAYYGYKYEGHQDKYWYGITQKMIWDAVRPDIKWKYKTSRYGNVSDNLYLKEEKEINDLINNHKILPSFNNQNFEIQLNEELELIDNNNLINNFMAIENEFVKTEIVKDKLKIIPKKSVDNLKLIFKRKHSSIKFLSSSKFQDMITRGDPDNEEFVINLTITKMPFYFSKVDKDSKTFVDNEQFSLRGTTFDLYKDDIKIDTLVFDKEQVLTYLDYGFYTLVEVKSGKGFMINKDPIEFIVAKDKTNHLIIENELIKSKLIIEKIDYDTGVLLSDVVFEVCNDNKCWEITTNEEGLAVLEDLTYGKYYVLEKRTKDGYLLDDKKYVFSIDSSDEVKLVVKNKTITNPETGDNILYYYITLGIGLFCLTIFGIKSWKNRT